MGTPRSAILLIQLAHCISSMSVTTRDCEVIGQCRNCGDGRYSYYKCASQADCFAGENCGGTGFCCPNSATFPTVAASYEFALTAPPTLIAPIMPMGVVPEGEEEQMCPDGHPPDSTCSRTEDCAVHHVCVEGVCCAGTLHKCAHRREQVIADLPSNDLYGVHLPQCDASGRLYRPKQCIPGSERCFCVSALGRRAPHLSAHSGCVDRRRKAPDLSSPARLRAELALMLHEICEEATTKPGRCPAVISTAGRDHWTSCECDEHCGGRSKCCRGKGEEDGVCVEPVKSTGAAPHTLTVNFSENSINAPFPLAASPQTMCGPAELLVSCASSCQPSCADLSTLPCPPVDCTPGCQCRPGFVRRDPSTNSPCVPRQLCPAFDASSNCADSRRNYLTCGSACPISCIERCVSGCFCRIPYILEDASDPLRSRCILPAECPMASMAPLTPLLTGPQPTPQFLVPSPTAPARPSFMPTTPYQQCIDPLKNYMPCGSACPASCANPSSSCATTQCVSGCFCRPPYVLVDGLQSSCVLPALCPPGTTKLACSDPRKQWSQCGANECAKSCRSPNGRDASSCLSGVCKAGCVCREPYVLADPADLNSRCILPAECANCEDARKEYLRCGSSCPVGCDNPSPRSCTPCQAGCFCKNGYVFANSSNWRSSECIPVDDCAAVTRRTTLPPTTTTTTPKSTTTSTTITTLRPTVASAHAHLARDPPAEKTIDLTVSTAYSTCPAHTGDVTGGPCNFDGDCPTGTLCCRSLVLPLAIAPQRCTCPDPSAAWTPCGTLCPDYCGSAAAPVCSSTCNAGCACLPGYVRARNDVKAPCVRREMCAGATARDVPPVADSNSDPFLSDPVAVATLSSRDSRVSGRISFSRLTAASLRIHGIFADLPPGPHAVIVHQFGDISAACSKLGPAIVPRSSTSGILGDVTGSDNGAEFVRQQDWSLEDIVGRSVAVYAESTLEWTQGARTSGRSAPLACGTIGVTRRR